MKKKIFILFISILFAGFFLAACGKDDETKSTSDKDIDDEFGMNDDESNATKEKKEGSKDISKDNDEKGSDKNKEKKKGKANSKSKGPTNSKFTKESKELIKYIEDETEGETNVLFENTESQKVELDAVTVELEGYTVMEFKDFHRDFDIPFDGEDKGGIILAKYSVENTKDEDIEYLPDFSVFYPGYKKATNNYRDLLPRDEDIQLQEKLSSKNDYELKAGEKLERYYAYPFSEENLKEIQKKKTINTKVSPGFADIEDFKTKFGEDDQFVISLNTEGTKKVESNAKFYKDRVTKDDMGNKKMLKEKEDIDKSEKLGNSKITLKGYQFTEFEPNEVEAPRFEQHKNGMVLATVKFEVENKESGIIDTSSLSSVMLTNNGSQRTISDGVLLPLGRDGKIEKGDKKEFLQIYLLDGEQYEKILKEKDFEIEMGPLRDDKGKDLSKGNKVEFKLPK